MWDSPRSGNVEMTTAFKVVMLRVGFDFTICLTCAAFGLRVPQLPQSLPNAMLLAIAALLFFFAAQAFRQVPNLNLGLLLGIGFLSGLTLTVLTSNCLPHLLATGFLIALLSLLIALTLGHVFNLDLPALRISTWLLSWVYMGVWILHLSGKLVASLQAPIAIVGLSLFSLATATWSSNLDQRLSHPAPALTLELYLLFYNLLIAGWMTLSAILG